ncbi:hypothetical protein B0H10DRAFT_2230287 [Mycena sp. CBHHK59/15]|nr:hypothetical protein B0H10DRAFT_2230287 [Mycena sp. CBHHK59/15]
MAPRQPTTRSSLFSHSFPSFYACYLLKSIQTPTSTATYIGSTPNPPKRIRQHNGELTQGARKTRLRRPWVMQMIVHGFPSRLAALQFEWAWQHPYSSRHLRDGDGKAMLRRSSTIKTNVQTVRLMISTHPYSSWPLHVKLFTDAAVKGWANANKDASVPALPQGFTYVIELEGVDGKSGQVGSGRDGPLSANDEHFTSAHLAKNTALLASNRQLTCSICHSELQNFSTVRVFFFLMSPSSSFIQNDKDPLTTTLCPATACTAVSHLVCLSADFLLSQPPDTGMIPRGGQCRSCHTYVLWGDIIRGMYRRSAGGATCEPEDDGDCDDLFLPDTEPEDLPAPDAPKSAKTRGKAKAAAPRQRCPALHEEESSEGEAFDFNVSSSSDSEQSSPRKRGRPRKGSPAAALPGPSPRKRARPPNPLPPQAPDSPKKRGRPPKSAGPARKYHATAQVIPEDSSDFFESDSLGDLGVAPLKYPAAEPRPAQKLALKPGEVDFFDDGQEGALSRAMSTLSVSSPEVIVLSD